eukprot:10357607-Lingulodinium_polyedra.AAC.1
MYWKRATTRAPRGLVQPRAHLQLNERGGRGEPDAAADTPRPTRVDAAQPLKRPCARRGLRKLN